MKYTSLAEAVQSICGQERTITAKSPVFGGDINEAFRLTLDDGTSLFMKSNAPNLLPAFEAEEADLAMTELFGGFSPDFYDTYFACAKMEAGYQDRKDIYNLYHLLNHLNLFGVSYLSSVERILRRYGRT